MAVPGPHRRGHPANRAVHDGVKSLRFTDQALRGCRSRLRTCGTGDGHEHGNDCQDDGGSAGEGHLESHRRGTSRASPQGDEQCSEHCGARWAGDSGPAQGEDVIIHVGPPSRSVCLMTICAGPAGRKAPECHASDATYDPTQLNGEWVTIAQMAGPSSPIPQAGANELARTPHGKAL